MSLSVCLHVSLQLPLDRLSLKLYLWDFYENLLRNSKFGWNWTTMLGTLHKYQGTFVWLKAVQQILLLSGGGRRTHLAFPWQSSMVLFCWQLHVGQQQYDVLPKISKNLLIITWILTLSPNFHCHLRSSHFGLVYNDPSDFASFGSTHWSLLALACLVPVAILLGSLQWERNTALSTRVSF